MWYLKVIYVDASKTKKKRCSLLESNKIYTVGRSHDCSFPLDIKGISSIHLQLKINTEDFPNKSSKLQVRVVGKNAKINDEFVDNVPLSEEQRWNQPFRDFTNNTTIILGTLKIKIYHKLILLKVPKDLKIDIDALEKIGINYNTHILSETTHLIASNNINSLSVLDALIRNIPIVTPSFLQSLIERESLLKDDFESNFPDSSQFLSNQSYKPNSTRLDIFNNILFVFGDSSQYELFTPILNNAKAQTILYQFNESTTAKIFQQDIKQYTDQNSVRVLLVKIQNSNSNFITSIHQHNNDTPQEYKNLVIMNDAAKALEVYLISHEEIFNAVKDLNVDSLFKKRKLNTVSTIASNDGPPLKKRVSRIKALDSLDFFAGGGKVETQTQVQKEEINDPKSLPASQILPDELPKKKQRSRIQKLSNSLLDTGYTKPFEGVLVEKTTIKESTPAIPTEESNSDISQGVISNGSKELQSKDNKIPGRNKTEDTNDESETQKFKKESQSLESAVQQTKKRADERINRELGSNELIDLDTVEQMRDLAIVETVDISLREINTSQHDDNNTSVSNKWKGRKNFKVFVKNSKHQNNEKSFYLHTREYVNLEDFDPYTDEKISVANAKLINEMESQKRKAKAGLQNGDNHENESFSFRDEKEFLLRQPTVSDELSLTKSIPLFVQSDDDEDEADGFQFSTQIGLHNDDGLDMQVKAGESNDECVPEFTRDYSREASERGMQLKRTTNTSTVKSRIPLFQETTSVSKKRVNEIDDDDDDDDDDDVPKFRFRR